MQVLAYLVFVILIGLLGLGVAALIARDCSFRR